MATAVNPAPQPSTSAAPPKPVVAAQPAIPGQPLSGDEEKQRGSMTQSYKQVMEKAKRDPEFSSPLTSFRYMLVCAITVVVGISVAAIWLLRYATDNDKWMRNESAVLGPETLKSDSFVVPRIGLQESELAAADREELDKLQTSDQPPEQTTLPEEGLAPAKAEEEASNQSTLDSTISRTGRSEGWRTTSGAKRRPRTSKNP